MVTLLILFLLMVGKIDCQVEEQQQEEETEMPTEPTEPQTEPSSQQEGDTEGPDSIQELDQGEDPDQEQDQDQDQENLKDIEPREVKPADDGNGSEMDPEALGGLDILKQSNNDSQAQTDETNPDDEYHSTNHNLDQTYTHNIEYITTETNTDIDNEIIHQSETTTEVITTVMNRHKGFIALLQEPECLNEGGNCGLYETCPECMRGRPGLCPKAEAKRGAYHYQANYNPKKDAAVCCYGMPVKETRCWKMRGECIPIHEYCPPNRIFADANDCDDNMKCCMKRHRNQFRLIEW